ncbi:MAG: hypothetical protein R3200_15755, partial [Xanthomonadales bacterium]|nr:hypothetical protein [Xanthomonadales bacterium]
MRSLKLLLTGTLVLLFSLGSPANAQETSIHGAISGLWFDAERPGYGLQVEIINPREAVIGWYAYDQNGNPLWLFGVGEIRAMTINASLMSFRGGTFPPGLDPAAVVGERWGEINVEFQDCDTAQLSWSPEASGFNSGSTELSRLTAIDGLSCGAAETFHRVVEFNFDAGPGPWSALFADFSDAQRDSIDTAAAWDA